MRLNCKVWKDVSKVLKLHYRVSLRSKAMIMFHISKNIPDGPMRHKCHNNPHSFLSQNININGHVNDCPRCLSRQNIFTVVWQQSWTEPLITLKLLFPSAGAFASWTTSTFSQANEADTSSKLIMTRQLFHWELSKINSHFPWRPLTPAIGSWVAFGRSELFIRLNSFGSGIWLGESAGNPRPLQVLETQTSLMSCSEMKADPELNEGSVVGCWWAGQRWNGGRGAEGRSVPGRCSSALPPRASQTKKSHHLSSQAAPLILPPQASRSSAALQPEASCHLRHVNSLICHDANEHVTAFDLQERPRFQQSGPKCQQIHHHGDRSGVELWAEEIVALHTVAQPKF